MRAHEERRAAAPRPRPCKERVGAGFRVRVQRLLLALVAERGTMESGRFRHRLRVLGRSINIKYCITIYISMIFLLLFFLLLPLHGWRRSAAAAPGRGGAPGRWRRGR